MKNLLPENWQKILGTEIKKPYFTDLSEFVLKQYDEEVIFPLKKDLFAALEFCSFDNVKVVILGQDPYHGEGQSHGLCFSVLDGVKIRPSVSYSNKPSRAF